MAIKTQIQTLKENWLIVVAILVLALAVQYIRLPDRALGMMESANYQGLGMAESKVASYDMGRPSIMPPYYGNEDFAPEEKLRLIVKTAYMQNEVKRGDFADADKELREIIKLSDAFLLSENMASYDSGVREYKTAYYNIKVDASKYDQLVAQLKQLGEVKSFSENAQDVTGEFKDRKLELEAEKAKLQRLKDLFSQAERMEDKIMLNEQIFNQERTVKYLEEAMDSEEQRIEYSTVSFTLSEKQSEYADIALVKLGELLRAFVSSVNTLLILLFKLIPYAVVALIAWVVYRKAKQR